MLLIDDEDDDDDGLAWTLERKLQSKSKPVERITSTQEVERSSFIRQKILKKLLPRLPSNFQHFLLA